MTMAYNSTEPGRRMPAVGPPAVWLLAVACCGLLGCRTSAGDASAWKWWDRDERYASLEGTAGPLERVLNWSLRDKQKRETVTPPEALAAYQAAEQLYQAGEYEQAEDAFESAAKKWPDTPVEEDALFMTAECQFEQKSYSWAQDGYDELIKKYPGTRHMNQATQRLFRIAQIWLQFPEIVQTSEIQQVNMEQPNATPTPPDNRPTSYDPSRVIPILPNLWDRSRPVFDTEGRGLQALKSIWLNDPMGPLADDALMLTASHHLREGNYLEADRIYTQLREHYPKSTHLEEAFVLGSHVRLMSYQGESYDGNSLESSRELKESTLRLYPEHAERERMLAEIREIDEESAAREWEAVEFWQKKNKPSSAAVYAREVIRLYPNSTYAARARALLQELEQEIQAQQSRDGFLPSLPELPSLPTPQLLPFGSGDGGAEPLVPPAPAPPAER